MISTRHILLVEDNPILQRIALVQLKKFAGVEVHLASDGWQSLSMVQKHQYCLILMDIHLPGIDGWETARRIRQMPNYESVPIVAISADGRESESLKAGMSDHVLKPAHYHQVLTRWLPDAVMTA
jgi:CheY-like chemotaxis protein